MKDVPALPDLDIEDDILDQHIPSMWEDLDMENSEGRERSDNMGQPIGSEGFKCV